MEAVFAAGFALVFVYLIGLISLIQSAVYF